MTEVPDVVKLYQAQAALAKAQALFFEKSVELEEKNNELKLKDKEILVLQQTIERITQEKEILQKELTHFKIDKSIDFEIINAMSYEDEIEATAVLVMGGKTDWTQKTIYLLNSDAKEWKELKLTLPYEMREFGTVVLNDTLYIIGGYSRGTKAQQEVHKLNNDGTWSEVAELNEKRTNLQHCCVVYKEEIWVIGGYLSGHKMLSDRSLKTVEKYNVAEDKWSYMPQLNSSRYHTTAAVFKDKIIVAGGYQIAALITVEMFDPELQQWSIFCDLPLDLYGQSMLLNNSILTIFGGYQGKSGPVNGVWEIDLEDPDKKWTKKEELKNPRSRFGIGKLPKGTIVFGDAGDFGDSTEIFDGSAWTDGPNIPKKLLDFGSIAIPHSIEERFLENFS